MFLGNLSLVFIYVRLFKLCKILVLMFLVFVGINIYVYVFILIKIYIIKDKFYVYIYSFIGNIVICFLEVSFFCGKYYIV